MTIAVLLTLALGIGANVAIFSVINAVLLKPLPYPTADRIVAIWERRPSGQPNAMTTLNYLDYAARSSVFERIAATTGCCGPTILDGEVPTSIYALRVSVAYFDIFGASAALGRTFAPGEDRPGRDRVVVLSHRMWASRFGSDSTLVGRTIRLNGEPHTVIGIMPANSPFDRMFVQAWLPLSFTPDRMDRTSHWLLSLTGGALGLLKPGVTLERARAEMDAIAARLSSEYPTTNKNWGAVLLPYGAVVVGKQLEESLVLLFAAVGMVLLIACVNVASVMLTRALTREREIAVRLALGAGAARLVRQFLIESLLISVSGGVLGVLVGYATSAFLKSALAALPLNLAMLPVLIPPEALIQVDWRVLLFAALVSVACGVAFGLAPAVATIRCTRDASIVPLRGTAVAPGHGRLRGALIVAEVALAFVLLANAALLLRSFFNMQRADVGFDAANVLAAAIPTAEHRFANADELHTFMHAVVARVEALPGVAAVAFTDGMPLQGGPNGTFVEIVGRPLVGRAQRPVVDYRLVSPSYFGVLGLRLQRGRTLSDGDRRNAPLVAVINETMARKYFAADDPIGQRLLMEAPGFGGAYSGESASFEVVGVIADERLGPFDDAREHPAVYVSNEQDSRGFTGIVVRTSLEPAVLEAALRKAVASVDRMQPVTDVRTVDQLKSESMIPDRLRALLLGVFAVIAVGLAGIGIYGVISYSVAQRTHEIGIRAALGATSADLVRMVVARGLGLAALGLALGSAGALATAPLLRSFLFGVKSSDPLALVAAMALIAVTATVACYVPARRAAAVDPLQALRTE